MQQLKMKAFKIIGLSLVIGLQIFQLTAQEFKEFDIIKKSAKPVDDKNKEIEKETTDKKGGFSISNLHFDGGYGLDTNPLALPRSNLDMTADRVIDEENFIDGKLSFAVDYNELIFFNAHAKKAYYSGDRRADEFSADAELKLKHHFNLFDTRWDYKISVDNSINDETFINRALGSVAVFNNQSIADRFDYSSLNFNAGLSFHFGSSSILGFDFQHGKEDYEDFDIPSIVSPDDPNLLLVLGNLDNTHNKLLLKIDFYTSDDSYYFGNLSLAQRDYLDRRANDINGNPIADSDLAFTYVDMSVGYVLEIDQDTLWRATFGYGRRQDNESGYWNSYHTFLSFYTEQVFATYHIFSADFNLSKYAYDPEFQLAASFQEEAFLEREGVSLTLDYQWIFATFFDTKIGVYASVKGDLDDIHTRYQAATGIRWTIF